MAGYRIPGPVCGGAGAVVAPRWHARALAAAAARAGLRRVAGLSGQRAAQVGARQRPELSLPLVPQSLARDQRRRLRRGGEDARGRRRHHPGGRRRRDLGRGIRRARSTADPVRAPLLPSPHFRPLRPDPRARLGEPERRLRHLRGAVRQARGGVRARPRRRLALGVVGALPDHGRQLRRRRLCFRAGIRPRHDALGGSAAAGVRALREQSQFDGRSASQEGLGLLRDRLQRAGLRSRTATTPSWPRRTSASPGRAAPAASARRPAAAPMKPWPRRRSPWDGWRARRSGRLTQASLCAADETTYFQCTVSKGRLAQRVRRCCEGQGAVPLRTTRAGRDGLSRETPKTRPVSCSTPTTFGRRPIAPKCGSRTPGQATCSSTTRKASAARPACRSRLPPERSVAIACSGPVKSRLSELKGVLRCDAQSALNLGQCP